MRSRTHKIHIVETLLKGGERTATDFHYISSTNQYFCALEHMGIVKSRWGRKGNAKVKLRSIADPKKALLFVGAKTSGKSR
ncbi:hypothetical protein [Nitratifractor sp.]|uniref:hypothetical protein n=1 Tax=Nitratifractor sp. TaxID=2268144 RepID=UPI0025FBE541|nr:hypothetical protein [Nitratifractor sp.]